MRRLIDEAEIREAVIQLGRQISSDYRNRPLTILGVLTGSIVLLADLIRRVDLPLRVGLIQARSYRGGATRPGPLRVNADLLPDISGRHVLLVDDIFDTGRTLCEVCAQVAGLGPRSVRSAVLLRKEGRREVDFEPDHVVFDIPDAFVVGYGLDYHDAYRNLPYVAALESGELHGESPDQEQP